MSRSDSESAFLTALEEIKQEVPIDQERVKTLQNQVKVSNLDPGSKSGLLKKIQPLVINPPKKKVPKKKVSEKEVSEKEVSEKVSNEKKEKNRLTKLSKFMALVLRHKCDEFGIEIDTGGFAKVCEILAAFDGDSSFDDVAEIVQNDQKKRFTLEDREEGLFIRCNNGHNNGVSVPDLEKKLLDVKSLPVEYLVHGTNPEAYKKIMKTGIHPMGRDVHLAKGPPGDSGVISGMRTDCQVHIYIKAKNVLEEGIPLFETSNGVICCPQVLETKYFHKIVINGKTVDFDQTQTCKRPVADELGTRMGFYLF